LALPSLSVQGPHYYLHFTIHGLKVMPNPSLYKNLTRSKDFVKIRFFNLHFEQLFFFTEPLPINCRILWFEKLTMQSKCAYHHPLLSFALLFGRINRRFLPF